MREELKPCPSYYPERYSWQPVEPLRSTHGHGLVLHADRAATDGGWEAAALVRIGGSTGCVLCCGARMLHPSSTCLMVSSSLQEEDTKKNVKGVSQSLLRCCLIEYKPQINLA
eukprot:3017475-Rhodomonas_salina.2